MDLERQGEGLKGRRGLLCDGASQGNKTGKGDQERGGEGFTVEGKGRKRNSTEKKCVEGLKKQTAMAHSLHVYSSQRGIHRAAAADKPRPHAGTRGEQHN